MIVKMLTNAAGPTFAYKPGDVVEVDDATGRAWIAAGAAEAVAPDESAPPAPPAIETATVKAPEAAVTRRGAPSVPKRRR